MGWAGWNWFSDYGTNGGDLWLYQEVIQVDIGPGMTKKVEISMIRRKAHSKQKVGQGESKGWSQGNIGHNSSSYQFHKVSLLFS